MNDNGQARAARRFVELEPEEVERRNRIVQARAASAGEALRIFGPTSERAPLLPGPVHCHSCGLRLPWCHEYAGFWVVCACCHRAEARRRDEHARGAARVLSRIGRRRPV